MRPPGAAGRDRPLAGSRHGFGSLHVGYYDPEGRLNDAGGVGSGYAARDLTEIKACLERIPSEPPDMLRSGEPLDPAIAWVRPELVIAMQFAAWSGAGRMRHAVFFGLCDGKAAPDGVREVAGRARGHTAAQANKQKALLTKQVARIWTGAWQAATRPRAEPLSAAQRQLTGAMIFAVARLAPNGGYASHRHDLGC